MSERLGELKERIEEGFVIKNIDNELITDLYKKYAVQRDFEAKLAKLCGYTSTLLIGVEYRDLGCKVNDIIENMYNEVERASKALSVEDKVRNLLIELSASR